MAGPTEAEDTILAAIRRMLAQLVIFGGGGDVSDIAEDIAAIRAATEAIEADGATEVTLADIKTAVEALAVDPATETTLASLKTAVDSLLAAAATEATLSTVADGIADIKNATEAIAGGGESSTHVLTVLPSTARTADTTSATQAAAGSRGLVLYFNVTVGSTTLQLFLEGQNPVSGAWIPLTNFSGVGGAVADLAYVVYPNAAGGGAVAGAVEVAALPLPRVWRVRVTHGDPTPVTYSVAAHLLP